MNRAEFSNLKNAPADFRRVAASDIEGPDRTLAYGFTCERHSWHAYLQSEMIHVLVYSENMVIEYSSRAQWSPKDLVPDKRLYPESVDRQFAYILLDHGVDAPYTTFSEDRYHRVKNLRFHGAVLVQDGPMVTLRG